MLLQGVNDEPFMGVSPSSWLVCCALLAFVVIAGTGLKLV